jgi:hypothetical protein
METIYSTETSVDFQRATRRYIPEDRTIRNHRCENLKSHIRKVFSWETDSVDSVFPNPPTVQGL